MIKLAQPAKAPDRPVIEMDCGITVYPPRAQGGRWRSVWYEAGERRYCEAVTEDKLVAKLEKVAERLQADAPNMRRPALITTLMTLHDQQREDSLDKRRGHRPRIKAGPGSGRRPVLTLADRLLAAVLHYRLTLPQVASAALLGVRPETINKRIRDIRELLDQAGHPIQPSLHRLANLDDLCRLARSTGIAIQPEIKTAC